MKKSQEPDAGILQNLTIVIIKEIIMKNTLTIKIILGVVIYIIQVVPLFAENSQKQLGTDR